MGEEYLLHGFVDSGDVCDEPVADRRELQASNCLSIGANGSSGMTFEGKAAWATNRNLKPLRFKSGQERLYAIDIVRGTCLGYHLSQGGLSNPLAICAISPRAAE